MHLIVFFVIIILNQIGINRFQIQTKSDFNSYNASLSTAQVLIYTLQFTMFTYHYNIFCNLLVSDFRLFFSLHTFVCAVNYHQNVQTSDEKKNDSQFLGSFPMVTAKFHFFFMCSEHVCSN